MASFLSPKNLYEPLNDNEIRLLGFEDATSPSNLLHCRLFVCSLDAFSEEYRAYLGAKGSLRQLRRKDVLDWQNARKGDQTHRTLGIPCRFTWGEYDTLSYAWGAHMSPRPILLNGHRVSVTRNLMSALHAMYKTRHYHGLRGLWVDALCINQNDEREKASQIGGMRHIYGVASRVVAWLGDKGKASDAAFDLLEIFADVGHQSVEAAFGQAQLPTKVFFGDYFYGLNQLMQRPYWSRLWIVQELVMGSASVVLRCGEREMDWRTFCAGIDLLNRADMWILKDQMLENEHRMRGVGAVHREQPVWTTLWIHLVHKDIQTLARYQEQGGGSLGLRRLLDIVSASDCRDVRDKVFALLGMMEPKIAKDLVQDYTDSPSMLFAKVARSFIIYYNDLEPLREGNPWSLTGTPSWAADWTWGGRLRYSRPETPLWGFWTLDEQPQVDPKGVYNAAGSLPAEFAFINDRTLTCKGFVVDLIIGLGAVAHGYFNWNASEVKQASSWRSAYGGRTETATALCRTLVLDRMAGNRHAEDRHAAILHLPKDFDVAKPQFQERKWPWMASQDGYYFRWELWREVHDGFVMGDWRLGDFFSSVLLDGSTERDYAEVYGAFDRTSKERRFMLTERGYMGWAPDNVTGHGGSSAHARTGDSIAIIFGCSTPLIIRPTPLGHFHVVGEAYVHGLMDGEARSLLKSGQCQIDKFTFI